VFYTAGVCFYLQRRKYAHTLWHLFVLAGSTSHFVAVCLALLRRA
jgi:hemolysin III